MIVFPAIDIRGGRCVRLLQGRADAQTDYGDPGQMAYRWASEGAQWLHVVDLDGAFSGEGGNLSAIREICKVSVPVQLGGGIRSLADIEQRLSLGVRRVILGTVALENPDLVREACRAYPDQVACGIDAKQGRVAVRGWVQTSDMLAFDLALQMRDAGIDWVIFTDIGRDGMLQGPNVQASAEMARIPGLNVIGSGGIGALAEIRSLRQVGCAGIITGKALYEGRFELRDAIRVAQSAEE